MHELVKQGHYPSRSRVERLLNSPLIQIWIFKEVFQEVRLEMNSTDKLGAPD